MLKKIALAFLAILAAIVGIAAAKPAEYRISREIAINAPVEKIYPYLSSQRLAEQWGPWLEVDPQAKMEYSGPEAGPGSKASWNSPGHLGTGSATIVDVVPNEKVGIQLEYTKPMEMHQYSVYSVKAAGQQTIVTWAVEGKNNLPGRVICLFMNMDKNVGAMFEKGLSNLKILVEKQV